MIALVVVLTDVEIGGNSGVGHVRGGVSFFFVASLCLSFGDTATKKTVTSTSQLIAAPRPQLCQKPQTSTSPPTSLPAAVEFIFLVLCFPSCGLVLCCDVHTGMFHLWVLYPSARGCLLHPARC